MTSVYLFTGLSELRESDLKQSAMDMPAERLEKALKYRNVLDRKNCMAAYLVLKHALRECYDIKEFTLGYSEYGKPYLKEYENIYFNISHCRYGCAVAVSDSHVGIDMQDIRTVSWDAIKLVCCEEEITVLRSSADLYKSFATMWAIKESYTKMLGSGLRLKFRNINTLNLSRAMVKMYNQFVISVYSNSGGSKGEIIEVGVSDVNRIVSCE